MPVTVLPPSIQAILNTAMGAMGKISYAGWGSFGPGPEALLRGITAPVVLRFSDYLPQEGWDPVAKAVIAEIINAVGNGDVEKGVFDTPEPVVYPVFSGPSLEIPEKSYLPPGNDEPEYVGIYGPKTTTTDWDDFYERYKILNPEEPPVSVFWDGVSAVIDVVQGQSPGGGMAGPTMLQAPTVPPGTWLGGGASPIPDKVTVDTKTGKVTPCRRRRRRRLLTPTDLNDLAALKTIVGGGQSMNFAVMKAVRR